MSTQHSAATITREPADQENLYLVVHHQRDSQQPFPNSWLDDDRLDAIETTPAIGRMCKEAKLSGRPIFVHRCAWDENPPVVCCRALVLDAVPIDRRTCYVRFGSQEVLAEPPPNTPCPGQNFYLTPTEEP
jgi:hypothetical protein